MRVHRSLPPLPESPSCLHPDIHSWRHCITYISQSQAIPSGTTSISTLEMHHQWAPSLSGSKDYITHLGLEEAKALTLPWQLTQLSLKWFSAQIKHQRTCFQFSRRCSLKDEGPDRIYDKRCMHGWIPEIHRKVFAFHVPSICDSLL